MTEAMGIFRGLLPTDRRVARSGALVFALLLAGFTALMTVQARAKLFLVKPPAPLSKPLPELARTIGPYEMVGEDQRLPEEEVATLGTEDYLLRRYRDTRKNPGDLGSFVSLNLNYYASGSATPHVPEVCWAGNGLEQSGNGFAPVENVPHEWGPPSTLRLHWVSFNAPHQGGSLAPTADSGAGLINVAYVFQVNGGYVSVKEEVARHFWDPKAKYAYHTKIEMTLTHEDGKTPMLADPKDAEPIFADFLRTALPAIEECLPDARKLAAESAGSPAPDSMPAPAAVPAKAER